MMKGSLSIRINPHSLIFIFRGGGNINGCQNECAANNLICGQSFIEDNIGQNRCANRLTQQAHRNQAGAEPF